MSASQKSGSSPQPVLNSVNAMDIRLMHRYLYVVLYRVIQMDISFKPAKLDIFYLIVPNLAAHFFVTTFIFSGNGSYI
jgi:hypothetical protein